MIEQITSHHEPSATDQLVRALVASRTRDLHGRSRPGQRHSGLLDHLRHRLPQPPSTRTRPIAATWRTHQRAQPLPHGGRVLCARHLLTAAGGEAASPAQAALLLDLIRRCLELQPDLRRIYTCVRNPADAAPRLEPLGFRALDEPPTRLDDTPYHSYVLDLGRGSADQWLAEVAGLDLAIDEPTKLFDTDMRDPMLDGEPVTGGALDPSRSQGPGRRGNAKSTTAALPAHTSAS